MFTEWLKISISKVPILTTRISYYVYQITPYLWTEKADKKKNETAE